METIYCNDKFNLNQLRDLLIINTDITVIITE